MIDLREVLAFDNQTADYALGVEVGRLWERLQAMPQEPVEQSMHAANTEMCIRIGETLGRPFSAELTDGDFRMTVRYGPSEGSEQ